MNWILLHNSILIAGTAAALACIAGFVAALLLASVGKGARALLLCCAVVVLALPPFLITTAWLDLPSVLHQSSWLPEPLGLTATICVLACMYWPIPMLAIWAAWCRLDPALIESDPSVRGWVFIRHVLLPLGRGSMVISALLTFVLCLNNFAVPSVLQAKTYPVEIWIRYNTALDWAGALTASLPLVLVSMLPLCWFLPRTVRWPHLRRAPGGLAFRRQLGRACISVSAIVTVFVGALSFVAPLILILGPVATWHSLPGAVAAGGHAALNSGLYAAAAAVLCSAAGLWLASLRVARKSGWVLWLLFFLPGTLIGIALSAALQQSWLAWLRDGAAAVVLVLFVRFLAIAWTTARVAIGGFDLALSDVATLDGADWRQRLVHVYWPQCGRQILAGAYAIYLLALWEVECVLPVVPPGGDTLAMRAFNLLHYGHTPEVNAICLMLLGLALLPLACFSLLRLVSLSRISVSLLFATAVLIPACSPNPEPVATSFPGVTFSRVEVIGSRGAGLGQFTKPRSVAVDSDDNLYVADMTGRVQKFSPAGGFLLSWQMPQTDLGRPKGMCRDNNGSIVVIEPHYSRVNHFTPAGALVMQWGRHGTNTGELAFPRAAAVNAAGEIYVSEYGLFERVQRFKLGYDKHANFLLSFGQRGDRPGQFNRPEGLGLDPGGRVFVADSCNHRIQIFSPDGQFLAAFGKAGSGPGELGYPYDVAVNKAGLRFVCEFGNNRIQIFDAQNRPVEIIGRAGSAPGEFNNPWSLALDSRGNLYVADSQNHRVQKLVRK